MTRRARLAEPRRRARRTGPLRGKPRIAADGARPGRVGERQRGAPAARAPAAPRCRCAGRTRPRVRVERRARGRAAAPRVSSWPATTCALVTTSAVARHPARALDAEPARGAEDLHHAGRPPPRTCGSRAMPARGGATRASGPSMRGNGSKRASALSSGPDGGSAVVEPLEDLRALDLVARRRRRSGRATAPRIHTTPSPTQRRQQRAEHAVDEAACRAASASTRRRDAEPLEAGREAPRRRSSAPTSPNAGAYGSARAVGQHQRRRAACRATRRARSRRARARR